MTKDTVARPTTAHTPGPWAYEVDESGASVFMDDSDPGRAYVAEVSSQPEQTANARLIAAAPDLLAALKRVMAEWLLVQAVSVNNYDAAMSAIAKAEGAR